MVGLQGCFDEAGADFGFARGVRDHLLAPSHHTRIPEDKTFLYELGIYTRGRCIQSIRPFSVSLSLCPRPSSVTFQTFLFPPASCLPDTLPASTNKHPQGLPEYFIYSATSFLFCLYPCLSGLPFSRAPPPSAVRAHHRCSLDSPCSSLLCSAISFPLLFFLDYLSERIFLRFPFLPTGLVIDAFHQPFLPFGPFFLHSDVLSLMLWRIRGFVFMIRSRGGGGKGIQCLCLLELFPFFLFSF